MAKKKQNTVLNQVEMKKLFTEHNIRNCTIDLRRLNVTSKLL